MYLEDGLSAKKEEIFLGEVGICVFVFVFVFAGEEIYPVEIVGREEGDSFG